MEFTSLIKRERVKNTFEQINNAVRAKMEDGGISCVLKLTSDHYIEKERIPLAHFLFQVCVSYRKPM